MDAVSDSPRRSHYAPPPAHALARPDPVATPVAAASHLLLLLFLLCLIPRGLMALRVPGLCNDGILYVRLATALEQGDWEYAVRSFGLNIYPAILAVLHRLGLEWETAGTVWGVTLAALTVLPLFGWVRRQFDDRLAVTACLLYAIHPRLISVSVEVLRDQTFWFLFLLAVYLSWRAVTEVRWRWFALAGLVIPAALHTRFEGWLLFFPLLGWSALRYRTLQRQHRFRLIAGVAWAVIGNPLILLTINLVCFSGQPHWEFGCFRRLEWIPQFGTELAERAAHWVGAYPVSTPQPPAPVGNAALAATLSQTCPAVNRSLVSSAWTLLRTLCGQGDAGIGVLILVGLWVGREHWLRAEHWPLIAMEVAVLCAVTVFLGVNRVIEYRHVFPILLLAFPCAALGWRSICHPTKWLPGGVGLGATWLLMTALTTADLLSRSEEQRRGDVALGKWLLAEWGPGKRLVHSDPGELVNYYSRGEGYYLPCDDLEVASFHLQVRQPDFIILSRRRFRPGTLELFLARAGRLGYESVDLWRTLPGGDWHDHLLLQHNRLTRLRLSHDDATEPITVESRALLGLIGSLDDRGRVAGRGDTSGYLAFGPFVPLEAGVYRITLDLAGVTGVPGTPVAAWDAGYFDAPVVSLGWGSVLPGVEQINALVTIPNHCNRLFQVRVYYLGPGTVAVRRLTIQRQGDAHPVGHSKELENGKSIVR